MKDYERARWRCRRGMLELDIILQRFMDQYYCQLGSEELIQFERLLSLADNDLWDLICARKPVMDDDLLPVIKLLQNS
ncbi:MAG: succinate dehydrogenase assembly factor 2 [Burkholderiales bacterium]|nr:succinate dehydrogenase assembly factor 2 [Nitrosomonas sp.]MCP5275960.1 succinate dehydrogenase assembly factor 2 [Burkholderiales bacterium]